MTGSQHATTCVRCCAKPVVVRATCSGCSVELAQMHWNAEYLLFDTPVYLTGVEAQWFRDNGYARFLRKPPQPEAHEPNEVMTL